MQSLNPLVIDPRAALAGLPDGVDIDVHEVSILCGCCVDHVGRLVKRGQFLKPHRLGMVRRWNLGMVRAFLRDHAEKANGAN